ncbi:hypothetical protein RAA17_13230 [Komagataeibacter rhaeticus]|nr:hypothetical protein [Komagataeibacter rhaeticus]
MGATHDAIIRMTDDRRGEITSAFRFDLQLKDADDWRKLPCRLEDMRAFNADNAFNDNPHVWPLVYLEDHDFPAPPRVTAPPGRNMARARPSCWA